MHRLAIVGAPPQLTHKTLRHWLARSGFSVWSGWPSDVKKAEDVWFGAPGEQPKGLPLVALADPKGIIPFTSLSAHKIRGTFLPLDKGWFVAALPPEDLDVQSGQAHKAPTLAIDARRALECDIPRVPEVRWLKGPRELPAGPESGVLVSVDIEGANGIPNIVGVAWDETHAFVFPWSEDLRAWLTELDKTHLTTYHNASYDIPELELAGVTPPDQWWDTIVMAALYDPSQPMNLQWQVLSHVSGSIAWKGLIDHNKGPEYEGGSVHTYRDLWTDVLTRLGRPVPATGQEWYRFYNALDTAWGLALANNLKRKLEAQGRWTYYLEVLQPLQRPLLEMGAQGMPLDTAKLAEHQANVARWKQEALNTVEEIGKSVALGKAEQLRYQIMDLETAREAERAVGSRKFSQGEALTKLRTKLKAACEFNPDSPKQLGDILYDHYGLPVIKTAKGGRSTNEDAIIELTSRVQRGTAKVKGDKDECLRVLSSVTAYNHWTHWLDTFLNAPVEHTSSGSILSTTYSLHRTTTGRLASGLDDSDLDKGGRRTRKVNLQNWPKELRDVVRAPEGFAFIGADYSGIEWAIAMWMVSKEYNDGYHLDMLDRFYRGEFDPHTFLAEIAGCERQVAKVFTHGYNYDGSPRSLARNAGLQDSVGITVCAAHDKAFRTRKWKDATVAKVKKAHKIQTPLGWRSYHWEWNPKPQEVLGRLVQGTAADLCKWVMGSIFRGLGGHCRLVTSTHDSFLVQVPDAKVGLVSEWLKDQMQQPVPWLDGRRWRADVKVGKTWKDVS